MGSKSMDSYKSGLVIGRYGKDSLILDPYNKTILKCNPIDGIRKIGDLHKIEKGPDGKINYIIKDRTPMGDAYFTISTDMKKCDIELTEVEEIPEIVEKYFKKTHEQSSIN